MELTGGFNMFGIFYQFPHMLNLTELKHLRNLIILMEKLHEIGFTILI